MPLQPASSRLTLRSHSHGQIVVRNPWLGFARGLNRQLCANRGSRYEEHDRDGKRRGRSPEDSRSRMPPPAPAYLSEAPEQYHVSLNSALTPDYQCTPWTCSSASYCAA